MTWQPTHCKPAQPVTHEVPVVNISTGSMNFVAQGSGPYRGVVIWDHGSGGGGKQSPANMTALGLEYNLADLVNGLVADSWIVGQPPQNGDNQAGGPSGQETAYQATMLADTGLLWTEHEGHRQKHVRSWVDRTFGPWPIVWGGFSVGGWTAAQAAANAAALGIVAAAIHHPGTIWSEIPILTTLFGRDTSGADLTAHFLDACTIPLGICWGTEDQVAGYTTPGSASGVPNGDNLPSSIIDQIAANAASAGVNVTTLVHPTNHELRSTEVGDQSTAGTWLHWFHTVAAPLCPATLTI